LTYLLIEGIVTALKSNLMKQLNMSIQKIIRAICFTTCNCMCMCRMQASSGRGCLRM